MRHAAEQESAPLRWLGLVWVYTGVIWLFALLGAVSQGWYPGSLAYTVRLAAALGVGVGLCASERWGWAMAVCQAGFYSVVGAALAAASGWAWVTAPPGTLTWRPIFFGLTTDSCFQLSINALLLSALSAAVLALLWRAQPNFDIPHRRAFTLLAGRGLVPVLPALLADAYLFSAWWSSASR